MDLVKEEGLLRLLPFYLHSMFGLTEHRTQAKR